MNRRQTKVNLRSKTKRQTVGPEQLKIRVYIYDTAVKNRVDAPSESNSTRVSSVGEPLSVNITTSRCLYICGRQLPRMRSDVSAVTETSRKLPISRFYAHTHRSSVYSTSVQIAVSDRHQWWAVVHNIDITIRRDCIEVRYRRQGGDVYASVRPSVRLFVNEIARKVFKRCSRNLVGLWTAVMGRTRKILGLMLLEMAAWQPLWFILCKGLCIMEAKSSEWRWKSLIANFRLMTDVSAVLNIF